MDAVIGTHSNYNTVEVVVLKSVVVVIVVVVVVKIRVVEIGVGEDTHRNSSSA